MKKTKMIEVLGLVVLAASPSRLHGQAPSPAPTTQDSQQRAPGTAAPVPAADSVVSLKFPATYVSARAKTDLLQLNADNSFSLQEAGQTYHGTFAVNGNAMELSISETSTKTTATLQGSNLTDGSGQTWVLREQSAPTASSAVVKAMVGGGAAPTAQQPAESAAGGEKVGLEPPQVYKPRPFPSGQHFINIEISVRKVAFLDKYRLEVSFIVPTGSATDRTTFVDVYESRTVAGVRSFRPAGAFEKLTGSWKPGDRVTLPQIELPKEFADPTKGWDLRFCVGSTAGCYPSPNLLVQEEAAPTLPEGAGIPPQPRSAYISPHPPAYESPDPNLRIPPNTTILDNFDGSSAGRASGVDYVKIPGAQPNRRGASFSRKLDSRIEYPQGIPSDGTLEWWINVASGYFYQDFQLQANQEQAVIFSTDAHGGDVTWPGLRNCSFPETATYLSL